MGPGGAHARATGPAARAGLCAVAPRPQEHQGEGRWPQARGGLLRVPHARAPAGQAAAPAAARVQRAPVALPVGGNGTTAPHARRQPGQQQLWRRGEPLPHARCAPHPPRTQPHPAPHQPPAVWHAPPPCAGSPPHASSLARNGRTRTPPHPAAHAAPCAPLYVMARTHAGQPGTSTFQRPHLGARGARHAALRRGGSHTYTCTLGSPTHAS